MSEDINEELSIFCNRLESINNYINLIESERKLAKIPNEKMKNMKELYDTVVYIKDNANSQVIYNAIIISLYSCYENYIDNILTKYLDKLSNSNIKYTNLPKPILENHIRLTGNFLSNSNRYKNYDLMEMDVINNLYSCLNENDEYFLNNRILITHAGNLGINALVSLFAQIGINNLLEKVKETIEYKEYYKIQNDIKNERELKRILSNSDSTIIFNTLQDLVNRRNEIAHSWNEDDRLSIQTIKEVYINFFIAFGKAIKDIIINELYAVLYANGKLIELSIIYNVFNNKVVCLNNMNQKLKRFDYIYVIKSNKKAYAMKIQNLQINKKNIEECNNENIDIGIELDRNITKNDKFFCIANNI